MAHFQKVLLRRLLLEDMPQDKVELAGDALLPLLLADPATYQSVGKWLLDNQQDERSRQAIYQSLGSLVSCGVSDISRQSMRLFRKQLGKVVCGVRGLLKLK